MEVPTTMLGIRYAAWSELGLVRTSNEDTAYAGPRLLAVADGVRGSGVGLASTQSSKRSNR
jgi:PPM family protein phosphatase